MAGMCSVLQTHTSQLLLPDALTLLRGHVQRRGPKMGHDHQELLEADLLHRSVVVLMEVSVEMKNVLTHLGSTDVKGGATMVTPSVEEGLDDLGADGVPGQIGDCLEMFPPEGVRAILRSGPALRQ